MIYFDLNGTAREQPCVVRELRRIDDRTVRGGGT
jgi:hypothetical protein